MEDRLDSIFSMQKGLENMMNLDRYPKDTEGKVSALCTAIMHEAVELQRTTNWKWWKTPTEFNEAEAREEDQETLAASKKEMKEWLRGHRLQNYAADVTRIAGECVASLPSLGMACLLA